MPLTPLGRADKSGGFMIVQYANGTYTHRMRVHFDKVNPADPTMTYQTASGSETTVFQTWTNLVNLLKPYHDSSWSYSLLSIYQNTGADPNTTGYNIFTEQFGWNAPTPIAGTATTATSAVNAPLFAAFNFHTAAGGRARIMIIGMGGAGYGVPYSVAASGTPSGPDQSLVSYLVGTNTAVRGHDGARFTGGAHVTTGVHKRLRRHYGQA